MEWFWLRTIEPDWQPVTSGPAVQLDGADYFEHLPLAPKRYGNQWRDFYLRHPERRGLLGLSRLGTSSTGLRAMRVGGSDGEERGLDFVVVWTAPDSQPIWHDLSRPMPKETAREFERQSFARQLTEVSQGVVTPALAGGPPRPLSRAPCAGHAFLQSPGSVGRDSGNFNSELTNHGPA